MLNYILSSKIYKGSKNKQAILAALSDPINKELLLQVNSYIEDDIEDKSSVKEPSENVDKETSARADKEEREQSPSKSSSPSPRAHKPMSFKSEPSEELESSDESEQEEAETVETPKEEVEESANAQSTVVSSTYITVDQISQAASKIPGTLNMQEETKGVTHVDVKGGSDNEFWVYYDSEVNINSVLEHVMYTLAADGYYYLEFHRVDRDTNAIVFNINWVSTYFKPVQVQSDENESQ